VPLVIVTHYAGRGRVKAPSAAAGAARAVGADAGSTASGGTIAERRAAAARALEGEPPAANGSGGEPEDPGVLDADDESESSGSPSWTSGPRTGKDA